MSIHNMPAPRARSYAKAKPGAGNAAQPAGWGKTPTSAAEGSEPGTSQHIRVVVIDDHTLFRRGITALLRGTGSSRRRSRRRFRRHQYRRCIRRRSCCSTCTCPASPASTRCKRSSRNRHAHRDVHRLRGGRRPACWHFARVRRYPQEHRERVPRRSVAVGSKASRSCRRR